MRAIKDLRDERLVASVSETDGAWSNEKREGERERERRRKEKGRKERKKFR